MSGYKLRVVVLSCALAAGLLAVPADSSACWGWLFGGWGARTTYAAPAWGSTYAPAYCSSGCSAPAYSAPACSSCVPQTTYSVPYTAYRMVYQQTPVTTYTACTRCDTCTGCPVTCYRPVTTWSYRAALVPYTTYRLVYSSACSSCASYSGCSTCVSGLGTTLQTGSSSCDSCTSFRATFDVGTEAAIQAAADESSVYSGGSDDAAEEGPALNPPHTFKDGLEGGGEQRDTTPDPGASSSSGPDLADPGSRTALRPIQQPVRLRLITTPLPPVTPQAQADYGGWRVSRD
jgi:hypothetical protein